MSSHRLCLRRGQCKCRLQCSRYLDVPPPTISMGSLERNRSFIFKCRNRRHVFSWVTKLQSVFLHKRLFVSGCPRCLRLLRLLRCRAVSRLEEKCASCFGSGLKAAVCQYSR